MDATWTPSPRTLAGSMTPEGPAGVEPWVRSGDRPEVYDAELLTWGMQSVAGPPTNRLASFRGKISPTCSLTAW